MLLWSIPLYMLAFYSYIGTKIILLPIIFVTGMYIWREFPDRQNKKNLRIFVCAITIFLGFFIYTLFAAGSATRISEIVSLRDPVISHAVDTIRKVSIRSPLVDLYVNKYTILATIILTKLSRIFSSDYLFAYGDQFFSLNTHGLFYFVDAFFLLVGLVTMFCIHKRKMVYVALFTAIGSIPHLVHGASTEDFTPHLVMMFPFLMIFIGFGIYETVRMVLPKFRTYLLFAVISIYCISLGNFLQIYWFQNSLSGQFDFPVRIMSKYIQIQEANRNVYVFVPRTTDIYKKYLFYSNSVNKKTLPSVQASLATNTIQIANVSFLGCNAQLVIPDNTTVVYNSECGSLPVSDSFLKLTRLKDGGQEFRIYNDIACKDYHLKPYPGNFAMKDLSIEAMERQVFCETYVIQ